MKELLTSPPKNRENNQKIQTIHPKGKGTLNENAAESLERRGGEASPQTQQHAHGNATAAILTALGPPHPPRINIVASSMTIWGQKEI